MSEPFVHNLSDSQINDTSEQSSYIVDSDENIFGSSTSIIDSVSLEEREDIH